MTPLCQPDQAACDQPKAMVMKHLNLDEPIAHRRLQQESQRRRLKEPARARQIIDAEELLDPADP